jgi:hypothetical protein
MTAHHLKPGAWHKVRDEVGDGAFRRLAQKVDLELLARLAEADCSGRPGGFDCSAMAWFLERAQSLGVQHARFKPVLLVLHLWRWAHTRPSLSDLRESELQLNRSRTSGGLAPTQSSARRRGHDRVAVIRRRRRAGSAGRLIRIPARRLRQPIGNEPRERRRFDVAATDERDGRAVSAGSSAPASAATVIAPLGPRRSASRKAIIASTIAASPTVTTESTNAWT